MPRIFLQPWSPEYGASLDFDPDLEVARVDETVEVDGAWEAVAGADDEVDVVALVDGSLRIDARLLVDGDDGPVAGICGSYAVGAVRWDRRAVRSEVCEMDVGRVAVFGNGRSHEVDAGPGLRFHPEAVAGDDPALLGRHLHGLMRRAESSLASRLATSGCFVVADGPLNELTTAETVGYIKSHRVSYLNPEGNHLVGSLGPGMRTPLFAMGEFRRYSWYCGLARRAPGTHPWSAVARCEVPAAAGLERALVLAARTTALLPLLASPAFRDPRAPQNLLPVGGLERVLQHRMGDRRLVYRAIRSAVVVEAA